MEHFNELEPETQELLVYLAEESSEVIQAVAKILRHGLTSCDPTKSRLVSNTKQLEKEIGQVFLAVDFLVKKGVIKSDNIKKAKNTKSKSIYKWLHHQD